MFTLLNRFTAYDMYAETRVRPTWVSPLLIYFFFNGSTGPAASIGFSALSPTWVGSLGHHCSGAYPIVLQNGLYASFLDAPLSLLLDAPSDPDDATGPRSRHMGRPDQARGRPPTSMAPSTCHHANAHVPNGPSGGMSPRRAPHPAAGAILDATRHRHSAGGPLPHHAIPRRRGCQLHHPPTMARY